LSQERSISNERTTNNFARNTVKVKSKDDFVKTKTQSNIDNVRHEPNELTSGRKRSVGTGNVQQQSQTQQRSTPEIQRSATKRENNMQERTPARQNIQRETRQQSDAPVQRTMRSEQRQPVTQQRSQTIERNVPSRSSNVRQQPERKSGGTVSREMKRGRH
jgi:hypothetical protein